MLDNGHEDIEKWIKSLRADGKDLEARQWQEYLDSKLLRPESGPKDPERDLVQGRQMADSGKHAEAIRCFDRIIRTGRKDYAVYELMAASQEAVGNLKKSVTYLNRALRLADGGDDARYRILVSLAGLMIRDGSPGKAVTIIERKGSGVSRPDSRLSDLHGRALMMQDKHERAVAVFREAAEAGAGGGGGEDGGQSPDPSLLAGLCKALYETGRYEEAARRGAEAGAGSAEANLYAGMALERMGQKGVAATHYRMAAAAGVSDACPDRDVEYGAEAMYRTGLYDEAARRLGLAPGDAAAAEDRVMPPEVRGPRSWCLAGRILEGMDRTGEAQDMYKRAAGADEKNGCSRSLYHAGLACHLLAISTGEASWDNKARGLLGRALGRNGLNPDAKNLMGEIPGLRGSKKNPKGRGRREGDGPQEGKRKEVVPGRRGGRGPDTAKRGADAGPGRTSKSDRGGGSLGAITKHAGQGHAETSAKTLARVAGLIMDGGYPEALDGLEKAEAAFKRGVPDSQAVIKAQYLRGVIYCNQGRYEEAVTCLERAGGGSGGSRRGPPYLECLDYEVGANPRRADTFFMIGLAHYRIGLKRQFEDGFNRTDSCYAAIQNLKRAIKLDPGIKGAKTLLGLANRQIAHQGVFGAEREAEAVLREAVKDDPGDAAALYHLAQIMEQQKIRAVDIGAERMTPREMYGRACKSRTSGLEKTYAKGFALDLLYRHDEAVEYYKMAIRKDPEYDEDFYREVDNARLIYSAAPESESEPGAYVIDTNVCIPCITMSVIEMLGEWTDGDVRKKPPAGAVKTAAPEIPRTWEQKRHLLDTFGECVSTGRYVIPRTCRHEISDKNMEEIILRELKLDAGSDLAKKIIRGAVKYRNKILPETRRGRPGSAPPTAEEFGYGDVMRVKRMYWLAWIRMTSKEKEKYMDKKKSGGRHIGGGPPLGSADVRILATAVRMAADYGGDTRVVLFSDDRDFLEFKNDIAKLSVDVRQG